MNYNQTTAELHTMALQEELELQGNWLFKRRGTLPLIILAIGTLLFVRTELHPDTFFLEDTVYEVYYERLCLAVCLLGLFIRVYTVGFTPANTSGRNTDGQLADSLNTTGIYSMVRHPLYLGNFFMWLGVAMLTGNGWFVIIFCLLYWVYYERIMFAEEQFLRRKFGSAYTEWAEKLPAFIPSFKAHQFVPPKYKFSWKKVLKNEKNGLFAVFLVFAAFNIIEELIDGKREYDYFIMGLCVATGLLYVVLKYLKTYTTVLNEAGR